MHNPYIALPFCLRGILLFVFILIFGIDNVEAKVSLPGIFSDNMVLQQRDNVRIWGSSTSKVVSITTSWDNKRYKVNVDDRNNWSTSVSTPAAGGPYFITFNDGDKLVLQNVLIGEVWVCSGQSNMDMPVIGFKNQPILNSTEILLEADNPQIRLIKYDRTLSRTPRTDSKSTFWQVSDAETAKDVSAVGYQFAQILQRKLKVPVGLIISSWGGTKIEPWMSANSLKSFPEIIVKPASDSTKISPQDPAVLFNAMINPFLGYGIKGALWYQGESNRTNPQIYDQLMVSLVKGWREAWEREMAFYYVQIAPYRYADRPLASALVREAQVKASDQIPNSGMAVTMDVGEEKSIHPANKTAISKRLAFQALARTYGIKGLPHLSPVYNSMTIDKSVVNILFDHAENGLSSFEKELSLFEVAGKDKVFHPAKARITATGVSVQSDQVATPVAVRYAFKDWVIGDLFNAEGFPASSFRTDNW